MSKLVYIGKGRWITGYPARDLSEDEVKKFGKAELLATGLYEESKKPVKGKKER